jgi:hypothetical protein
MLFHRKAVGGQGEQAFCRGQRQGTHCQCDRGRGLVRPSCPPLAMLKTLLLQRWYSLSDEGLEEALSDRLPFRRFCGFALE